MTPSAIFTNSPDLIFIRLIIFPCRSSSELTPAIRILKVAARGKIEGVRVQIWGSLWDHSPMRDIGTLRVTKCKQLERSRCDHLKTLIVVCMYLTFLYQWPKKYFVI